MENLSFDLRDLKTLFIGMTGGLLIYYLRVFAERYWSYRSAKSIQKRIKYIEDDKLVLENLAKSDRAVFLRSFIILFEMIRWGLAVFAFHFWLNLIQGPIYSVDAIVLGTLPLFGWLATKAVHDLRRLNKYPESIEKINQNIDSLKARLSKLTE